MIGIMTLDRTQYVDYSVDNHVHRFVMLDSSRDAINAYFDLLQEALESLEAGEPFLAIFDATQSGFPAVGPTIKRGASIANTYGRKRVMRTLVVHNNPTVANIAKTMMRALWFLNARLYWKVKWNRRWSGCLVKRIYLHHKSFDR